MPKGAALVLKILSGMLAAMGLLLIYMDVTDYSKAPTMLSGSAALIMAGALFFMASQAEKKSQ